MAYIQQTLHIGNCDDRLTVQINQKVVTVEIVLEYLVSLNTPRDYMVQCPSSIYSLLSWHKSHIVIKTPRSKL